MGVAASQTRIAFLAARKLDIEVQQMSINNKLTILAHTSSQLSRAAANEVYQENNIEILGDTNVMPGYQDPVTGGALPTSAIPAGVLDAQIQLVANVEKELTLRAQDLSTQHKQIETELENDQKLADKNVEKGTSFKMFS